jgi:uncharacterized OB-fold protein
MFPIKLIDKTHHGAHAEMEYTVPEAQRGFWMGQFPVEGRIVSLMCDDCGRILLYGVPYAEPPAAST